MSKGIKGVVSVYQDGELLCQTNNLITNLGRQYILGRMMRFAQRFIQYDDTVFTNQIGNGQFDAERPTGNGADGIGYSTHSINNYDGANLGLSGVSPGDAQFMSYPTSRSATAGNDLNTEMQRSNVELRFGGSNQAPAATDSHLISPHGGSKTDANNHNRWQPTNASYFHSGDFNSSTANTDNATNQDMEFLFAPDVGVPDTFGYIIGSGVGLDGTGGSKFVNTTTTSLTVATPQLFPVAVQSDSSTHYYIEITDVSGGSGDGQSEFVKVTNTGSHQVSTKKPAIALSGYSFTPKVRPYFTRISEFTVVRNRNPETGGAGSGAIVVPTQSNTGLSTTNKGNQFKTVMPRKTFYFASTGSNNASSASKDIPDLTKSENYSVYHSEAILEVIMQPYLNSAGGSGSFGSPVNVAFSRVVFPQPIKMTRDSFLFELVWDIQFP